ncbi:hypothetical protein [Mycolicibacterium peregrinum]|uniref:Uncharacterized protein n=1 Tax=Mycolicibacterium peregrinum TaxID=43304 RepID=A0A4Z0HKE1_MYCPR|nr:hypothetical protein [Mycolicibacterium peregrinum]TGB37910.1 hypothetical protein EJD98_25510 [Mycolicibacterium peregrinum]TGB38071.1 hypothetical protein EJD94_25055 [Mycolicibacterium peregrinum]
MTDPTIAERAEGAVSSIDTYMRTCHPYRSAERVPATMADVRGLAELVRDLSRSAEQQPASAVLVKHQGPFFTGVEMRCGCGEVVEDALAWAAHAIEQMGGNGE